MAFYRRLSGFQFHNRAFHFFVDMERSKIILATEWCFIKELECWFYYRAFMPFLYLESWSRRLSYFTLWTVVFGLHTVLLWLDYRCWFPVVKHVQNIFVRIPPHQNPKMNYQTVSCTEIKSKAYECVDLTYLINRVVILSSGLALAGLRKTNELNKTRYQTFIKNDPPMPVQQILSTFNDYVE